MAYPSHRFKKLEDNFHCDIRASGVSTLFNAPLNHQKCYDFDYEGMEWKQ